MTKNNPTPNKTVIAAIAIALALLAVPAAALISNTNIEDRIFGEDRIRDVFIRDSQGHDLSIKDATLSGSAVERASIEDATIERSHLRHVDVRDAYLEDSRVKHASLDDVTLQDTTLCNADLNGDAGFGDCALLSSKDGEHTIYARLAQDAPQAVEPGASYDLRIEDAQADTLVIHNQAAGLVGLGFEPDADPLSLTTIGHPAAAANESVESFELWADGERMATFGFGDAVDLPGGDFMVRVQAAEEGIVDHSRLALVLDLDGHELRTEMTSFDVTATALAIAPDELQFMAPFLSDNVARLVLSVAVDGAGNVDRDVNISASVNVTDVQSGDVELVGDLNDHANLHDDSKLFSDAPFTYGMEVDAAHHPQSLEFLVRAGLVSGLANGAIPAYGTHLVTMSPFATNVTLEARGMNADGEMLKATKDIQLGAAKADERTVEFFGTEFVLPGRGELDVNFVDSDGEPVQAGEDWALSVEETPESHAVKMVLAVPEGAEGMQQELAASSQPTTPFGNFALSEYEVCVEHDGGSDCSDLVAIETGKTTSIDITIG